MSTHCHQRRMNVTLPSLPPSLSLPHTGAQVLLLMLFFLFLSILPYVLPQPSSSYTGFFNIISSHMRILTYIDIMTSPNSLQTALQASFPLLNSGSSGFGVVEPPRTHSNLPCRPASPFVTVVQGGSVGSNYPKLTPTFPVGLFPLLLQKFSPDKSYIHTTPILVYNKNIYFCRML